MEVTVKLFSPLKEVAEVSELHIALPLNASIRMLLERLSADYGDVFRHYLFNDDTGGIRSHLHLVVDGKYLASLERQSITLKPGSFVAILPPIGGGSSIAI